MNGSPAAQGVFRSVRAILAGFVLVVASSSATDAILHTTGIFPPQGQPMSDSLFLLATVYRVIYAIAGSYLTARMAPNRPMRHALALGVLGLIAGAAGAILTWNAGPEFGPKWYPLALVATALPCAWIGGKLLPGSRIFRAESLGTSGPT